MNVVIEGNCISTLPDSESLNISISPKIDLWGFSNGQFIYGDKYNQNTDQDDILVGRIIYILFN